MKELLISAFVVLLMISIVGCNGTIPPVSSALKESSSYTAQKDTPSSDNTELMPTEEDILATLPEKVAMYFRYLDFMPMAILYDGDPNFGFTDTSISGFAISMAIKQQEKSYDFEKGVSKELLDGITKKYFNRVVVNYNNRLTHILDNGNIASTGWGSNGLSYILKDISRDKTGITTAVFYVISDGYGDDIEYLQRIKDIVNGNFDKYGDVFLSEIKFIEKTDEDNNFYMQFISLKGLGKAEKPYVIYNGK